MAVGSTTAESVQVTNARASAVIGTKAKRFMGDFQWVGPGTFTVSGFTTVTMNDVIAVDGARSPNYMSAPNAFRGITVILTDEPLMHWQWLSLDEDVYEFALAGDDGKTNYNFWEATGGRATLQLDG